MSTSGSVGPSNASSACFLIAASAGVSERNPEILLVPAPTALPAAPIPRKAWVPK